MFLLLWLSDFHLISLCHRVNCFRLGGLEGDSVTNTTWFSTLIPSQVLTVPLKWSTNSTWSRLQSGVTRRRTLQSRSRWETSRLQGALLFPPSWRLVYLSTASPHGAATDTLPQPVPCSDHPLLSTPLLFISKFSLSLIFRLPPPHCSCLDPHCTRLSYLTTCLRLSGKGSPRTILNSSSVPSPSHILTYKDNVIRGFSDDFSKAYNDYRHQRSICARTFWWPTSACFYTTHVSNMKWDRCYQERATHLTILIAPAPSFPLYESVSWIFFYMTQK